VVAYRSVSGAREGAVMRARGAVAMNPGSVVGRERELAAVNAFLTAVPDGPRALLVEGEAGIGKTTVWLAAVRAAGDRGFRVLQARPAESESRLSYAAVAEQAVAGNAPVKRNRFIQLTGGTRSVNRELEAKARALAGIKGYLTNLAACPDGTPVTAEFVISSYRRLSEIEKSFRMAKSDLQARPIYHHQRDFIEAHLTIVFAALAVSRWIERQTGWSIRKFVKTAAATAPSRSRPAPTPSPPPTPCPTTSARPSTPSTAGRVRTK
jgi:hypothetical protein